eukprot:scaffold23188_cov42-Cyclotella_meneghiniana.AAC.3
MATFCRFIVFAKVAYLFGVFCLVEQVAIIVTVRFAIVAEEDLSLACSATSCSCLLETHIGRTNDVKWLKSRFVSSTWQPMLGNFVKETPKVGKMTSDQVTLLGDNTMAHGYQ